MSKKSLNSAPHKPNYIAIGIVLGTCFMVAMESPAFFVFGLMIGVALDRLKKEPQA